MNQRISIPLLDRREIEASIVGPLLRAFSDEVGEEKARMILQNVVRQIAQIGGCNAAQLLGGNDLSSLAEAVDSWRVGDALTLEIGRQDEQAFEFNVTRCRFAEMYHRLGLKDLGAILSCSRDAAMIEGFNPEISFTRTQTIMEGAPHCDFRYYKKSCN